MEEGRTEEREDKACLSPICGGPEGGMNLTLQRLPSCVPASEAIHFPACNHLHVGLLLLLHPVIMFGFFKG